MVKCEVKVLTLQIDKDEVLSGAEQGLARSGDDKVLIFKRGDIIEVSHEKFKQLGLSVTRHLIPAPSITDITQYTPDQIEALDKLDAEKAKIIKSPKNL